MDRGNLADLTAFVLADQASFLYEGTSRQWVNRVILTERRSLPLYPDKQTISEPVLSRGLRPSQNPSNRCASCFRCHGCSGHRV